ncbi:jg14054, partial [Pararge aegeria aegeria]
VDDLSGSVALILRAATESPSFECIIRGRGFVVAKTGKVVVAGVYASPNSPLADFESLLGNLGIVVSRIHPRPVFVLGDFNAKSAAWGSSITNARGRILEEWAIEQGLVVLNQGSVHTCVRQMGGSIVDVSFASTAVSRRVREWRVMAEVETLSDHRYIRFVLSPLASDGQVRGLGDGPRWALKRLNKEALLEASIVQAWASVPIRPIDVNEEAEWFREALSQICDAAMPRVLQRPARRQVYWWSQTIEHLRSACVLARRQYARHRRRRRRNQNSAAIEAELYETYRVTKRALQTAIKSAKVQAYEELLKTLDVDPWGRPYRLVNGKLRPWAPPITQSLDPQLLEDVVCSLFPSRLEHTPPPMAPHSGLPDADDDDIPEVTRFDLRVALRRLQAKNTAPGPDGIPGRALVLAIKALEPRLLGLFCACLERGQFPLLWKTGKLVLLKKVGRPVGSASAYRPIVLLDEVGKLLERIISERLVKHLERVGPDLADNQFGFRRGRSTVEAIMRVKAMTEEAFHRGEVVLAVSLDIANAFNTLPWSCIRDALVYHRVPNYLRHVIEAYLADRAVIYPCQQGWGRRESSCGVPQGSVLGPLLWNIGYDWVLRGLLLPGVGVTCYADDTLVTACRESYPQAIMLATAGVAQVVGRIRRLGLEVALNKCEAMFFYGPRRAPPSGSH